MFCWSQTALSVFSTEQMREELGVGRLPAPAIRHPSAINRESQCVWFMSPCGKHQHGLVQKPPSPPFDSFGKLIFSPYWPVFKAPSTFPLPVPQAFLCLSCHFLFSKSLQITPTNCITTPSLHVLLFALSPLLHKRWLRKYPFPLTF